MSGILRAVSRVALGLSLTICSAGVQNPPTTTAGSAQQTPTPPLRVTAQQTPEQRALQDAIRIQDPVEKLAALRKVRSELTGPVAAYLGRQVDEAILWHLVEQFRNRRDEIAEAFDRVRGHLPQGSTEVRLGQLVSTVSRLLDNKIYLDTAEQAVRVEPSPVRKDPASRFAARRTRRSITRLICPRSGPTLIDR